MSTAEQPTVRLEVSRGDALRDPAALITAAAGALLLAGLAVVLADPGAIEATLALTAAGSVLGLALLIPLAVAAVRRHPTWLALAFAPVLLYGLAVVLGNPFFVGDYVRPLVSVLAPVAVLTAFVLLADDLRRRFAIDAGAPTPWQRLTGTASTPPLTAGVLALVAMSLVLVLGWTAGAAGALFVLVVIGVPVGVALFARSDRDRVQAARDDVRQDMAAHLHDSVLQTLALVQRQAHDPRSVARLARRQEHELRAWMAGEIELGAETLAGALRAAIAEVEDAHDVVVEATILGDRPLERTGEALAAAAREALRNAARHAPGAPVFVFADIGASRVEVFVRDDGPGFVCEDVPTERRGVRDAIVGRMAAAGGRGSVESAPGEGTEVALTIGGRG